MTDRPPPSRLVIERIRIRNLAGPAPSEDAVRQAVVAALRDGGAAPRAGNGPLKPGATLADAATVAAAAIRRHRT